jgi:hypothetical protein
MESLLPLLLALRVWRNECATKISKLWFNWESGVRFSWNFVWSDAHPLTPKAAEEEKQGGCAAEINGTALAETNGGGNKWAETNGTALTLIAKRRSLR